MIVVLDYGVGNLFSLLSALRGLGARCVVTRDPALIGEAERVILPGVGAFGDAIDSLRMCGLTAPLDSFVKTGRPLLGICLGMQLLFETGYEFGAHKGLGYIRGSIHDLAPDIPKAFKVPHMGWNSLRLLKPHDPLLRYVREGDYVYYVHSFYAKGCVDCVIADSDYGASVPGIVHEGNVYGTQFHPEKSGDVGQKLLKAFLEI